MRTPADALTVLRTKGRLAATKTYSRNADGGVERTGFAKAKWFDVRTVPVSSFGDLAAALDRLSGDPRSMVVRGEVCRRPRIDGSIRRTKWMSEGSNGCLKEAPRRWAVFDADGLPLPDGLDCRRAAERVATYIREALGGPFAEASMWYGFSASAGMPGKEGMAYAHIAFWLDRPVSDAELADVCHAVNERLGGRYFDPSIYSPEHAHYTASPVFGEGVEDPLPTRTGVVRGVRDDVDASRLPSPAPKTARKRKAKLEGKPVATQVKPVPDIPAFVDAQGLVAAEHRVRTIRADILKLAAIRFGNAVPKGWRNKFVLAYGIACAVEDPDPVSVVGRVMEAVRILAPGKSRAWVEAKLCSLLQRCREHMAGGFRVFAGQRWSPVYSPSPAWYAAYLGVGRAEASSLAAMVGRAEAMRRVRAARRPQGKRASDVAAKIDAVDAAERSLRKALGRTPKDSEVAKAVCMGTRTVNRVRNRQFNGWGRSVLPFEAAECANIDRNACPSDNTLFFASVCKGLEGDRHTGSGDRKADTGHPEAISRPPEGYPREGGDFGSPPPGLREGGGGTAEREETVLPRVERAEIGTFDGRGWESIAEDRGENPLRNEVGVDGFMGINAIGSPVNGLWNALPVQRRPSPRRGRQSVPAPVSDEHRGIDFWTSSFEEWCTPANG